MAETMPDGTYNRTLIYPWDAFGHRTEIFDYRPSQNWVGADQWWAQVAGQRLLMGGSTSYLRHGDAVGSTTMVTDQTGAVNGDVEYDPWGNELAGGGNNGYAFGDLGFQINYPLPPSATRDYNPGLGRWLTPDKLGGDITNPQSLNRYAYALNNPATLSDPLGLDPYDNPGDPCSDPTYAESNAQCQGGCGFLNPEECPPACSSLNPESSIYCDCIEFGQCGGYYGWGYGGYGGGGGGSIPPPAGQPPLAGGGEGGFGTFPFGCPFPYNSMGLCGLSPNYWTGQIGASVNVTLPWGVNVSYFAGLAIDLHGHFALYHGGGIGHGVGTSGSAGVQLGQSNAYTVCGLRGPFAQASGTAGEGTSGTIDVFQGKGNGPGGLVTGGTVTIGPGGGAASSAQVTYTRVVPFHGQCGQGGMQ